MMRCLYRGLIALHPSAFKERFGEEMLWIYDESSQRELFHLLVDAFISLLRQRLVRSGIWRFGVGAFVSTLLLLSCGYSLQVALASAFRRGNPGHYAELRERSIQEPPDASSNVPTYKGWPIQPVKVSPPIAALVQRIHSGDRQALDSFWQSITKNGTPLVDATGNSANDVIATFVWRGNKETKSVGIRAPLAKWPGLPDLPLAHLPDTDVWYGSWQMKNDFRFTYSFVVNLPSGERAEKFTRFDPLNPHKMALSFESSDVPVQSFSIASMPEAPTERWLAPQQGAAAGKVTSVTLPSMSLGSDRKIWVYMPPGYGLRASKPYRLLVLFDGFSYLYWIPAPTILDNLIRANQLPPMVAVLIDNPPESRSSDLHASPAFLRFLTEELMPWLHAHFNVTHDPAETIIGGYSLGGLAAAFTAMRRPDLFGNVLSQSGSFWEGNANIKWEFLASKFQSSPRLPIRFFMEAGLLEDVSDEGPTLLAANRHLAAILKAKGYSVTYQEVGGTHEPVHWRDTLPPGLLALAK